MPSGTWDRNVKWEEMKRRLAAYLREAREKARTAKQKGNERNYITWRRRFTYTAILLTQLKNGCRIREAIEAARKFAETGEKIVAVRLEKQKREDYIEIVRPKEIFDSDLELFDLEKASRQVLYKFAREHFGINTHSLRYSFVTRVGERGLSLSVIAKMTGHKNPRYLETYTQRAEALRIKEELARE